jgi:16S rRNA (guanine527-N7)-methyltransferase
MDKNRYDVVVSRAVAPLKELYKWSKPLLVKKNRFIRDTEEKVIPHGLICLKGGELAAEISESRTRPRIMEIAELFQEEYFTEKYILYVSGGG